MRFAGESVPLDSVANELGSLRLIQQQRYRSGSIATVAGYTSVALAIVVVSVCICVLYCWHILRGGRSVTTAVRSIARQHPRMQEAEARHSVAMEPLNVDS